MQYHYAIDTHPLNNEDKRLYIWKFEVVNLKACRYLYYLGIQGPFLNEEVANKMLQTLPKESNEPSIYEFRVKRAEQYGPPPVKVRSLSWLDKYFIRF